MSKCKVGQILLEANPEECVYFAAALSDSDSWSAKSLASAVNKTRFTVGATTIKIHRRQECGCFYDN